MKAILTTYLNDLKVIYSSGRATDERSYYPVLAAMLSAIGTGLNPKVVALHETADKGEGHPDFLIQVPETDETRAAVEAKGTGPLLESVINSEQIERYLEGYGLALATNLRDFALVRAGHSGPEIIMRHTLSKDEKSFWTTSVKKIVDEHADRFGDFLISALSWSAPITRPDDLADALARHAREALRRLEAQPAETLIPLKQALSDALGLHFSGDEGEHFFRSTLVQTLFYGLFSAWVVWNRQGAVTAFRWREAGDYLSLPIVRELFERIAIANQLEALDIRRPLEWSEEALNRTVWEPFAKAFGDAESIPNAVNYFYEPFLAAFDPQLRKDLGVWYTPREVVQYMVTRVDTILREELGILQGLADPRVVVLDPACGTGAYLVEVLRYIAEMLPHDGLHGAEIQKAATSRVFGFEILPAPFIVAHLQVGMLLTDMGAPLGDNRAGIYLTNALTGWEKKGVKQLSLPSFPALKQEAEAASQVKLGERILVIIGNPPYNGFAGVAVEEERELTNAYRTTVRAPRPQGQGLNDLYVRFYRMAERQIVERTKQGVVCFISNYSWLDGLSFPGMRERYLDVFDQIWIDCLNGDKFRTGKVTPDGDPDPSIFSTPFNREGIQVGTAIALMVRKSEPPTPEPVRFRHLWGAGKREELIDSLNYDAIGLYESIDSPVELGLPFFPTQVGVGYYAWPLLPDLFPVSFPGVQTSRDEGLVEIDRELLETRIQQYFDPSISHQEMARISPRLMEDAARFDALGTREHLLRRGLLPNNIVRFCYRPYDTRWLYWEPETKLLDEKRSEYVTHVFEGNIWIGAVQQNRKDFDPPLVTSDTCSRHVIERGANLFPLYLKIDAHNATLFDQDKDIKPNLSDKSLAYLTVMEASEADLFYHIIATLHAPAYCSENAGALRRDWPRIPLPSNAEVLVASAALGRTIATLLDPELPIPADLPPDILGLLSGIAVPRRADGRQIDPAHDLVVNVNWGYAGQGGANMPGGGKSKERPVDPAYRALGKTTFDIYMNDVACWENVPALVWTYTLGGYPVIKKWLSYRETDLLDRPLTVDEVRLVQGIAQRIAAILLLRDRLDENYQAVTLGH